MAIFAFDSPLSAGKCALPVTITPIAQSITFDLNGATKMTGTFEVVLVAEGDWTYSDTPGSGRTIPLKAGQTLTLPVYDGLTIEATAAAPCALGAMLVGGE